MSSLDAFPGKIGETAGESVELGPGLVMAPCRLDHTLPRVDEDRLRTGEVREAEETAIVAEADLVQRSLCRGQHFVAHRLRFPARLSDFFGSKPYFALQTVSLQRQFRRHEAALSLRFGDLRLAKTL